jgi:hypothetical protein
MRWRKLGRIFKTAGQEPWMQSHASMPFAEALGGNILRIWFTPRDAQNRSHLAWLEVDIAAPQDVKQLALRPTLAPGPEGAFDDNGAMGSWLVRHGGERRHYYIGWTQSGADPFHVAIGLATASDDGTDFSRRGPGPVLDRSAADPVMVSTPCVLQERGRWRMWYLSVIGWPDKTQPPHYDLRHAVSRDGLSWTPDPTPCIAVSHPGECAIARPSVIRDKDRWRMWYSYRGMDFPYRIGYAESHDGVSWVRRDEMAGIATSDSGWDDAMIAYPFVFDHAGGRYMLYAGNGYGREGMGLAILEQD